MIEQTQTERNYSAIVSRYRLAEPVRIEREESGMNNTTRMIYAGAERYVLRVYENHNDRAIVSLEHAILRALGGSGLSFHVPAPVRNAAQDTVTEAPDGKLAAIFGYIGGERPTASSPSHIEGLGRAAGELTRKLGSLEALAKLKAVYQPYYEFEDIHAAMDEAAIRTLSAKLQLTPGRCGQVEALLDVKHRLTALIDRFKKLPRQWIHGDIVFANALASGEAIVGLLDFEFCTIDARAMELAVICAEFPCEDDALSLERISLLCKGYGSRSRLDRDEIALLPDLIQLRMIDVWLHFAGRLADGLDREDVWVQQIERVSFVCGWVERNRPRLPAVLEAAAMQQSTVQAH
ncbi:phosphotransferase [Paenibacillus lycopersici]|uniref:Phosphotransferase n=1 Tax=Paenibacillus lycopersici TaxID=2704462 RepID=A0A6C0FY82_9BACL|nr:phosphotransferase [Paenibacillus lycopersici]QHT61637.1 phosphotransferase [Paenibacillus lycopersici]